MLTIDDAIDVATRLAGNPCPKTSEALARYIDAYFKGLEDEDLAALETAIELFARRERADRWGYLG